MVFDLVPVAVHHGTTGLLERLHHGPSLFVVALGVDFVEEIALLLVFFADLVQLCVLFLLHLIDSAFRFQ